MRVFTPILLLLSLFVYACNSPAGKDAQDQTEQTLTETRPFSHSSLADTFKVTLKGNDPKTMQILFRIVSHEGKEIFKKELSAAEILDNYKQSIELSEEKVQRSFVTDEFKLFLDEENFLEPAITADEEGDAQSPDPLFFNELKASGLNGFKYRMGNETKVYIAWSEKAKQVKVYYSCC